MQSIFRGSSTESGSKSAWSGFRRVGGADELPPTFNDVLSCKNHDDHLSARRELDERVEEWLAVMFGVEFFGLVYCEFDHVQIENPHVVFDDFGQNISNVAILDGVGLDDRASVLEHARTVQSNMVKTRLEQIFDEIVKHVRWTGDVILSAPSDFWRARGRIVCTETGMRSWSISVSHVKQDLDAMQDQTKADLLRKSMVTSQGRMNIARSFPGQCNDVLGPNRTMPPTFECPRCAARTWVPEYSAECHSKEECDEFLTSHVMES